MTWDTGTWDSGHWDAAAPPVSDYLLHQSKPKSKMKRQVYYPSRIGDQVIWLDNYANKFPGHGPTLNVAPDDIALTVNDAKWAKHVLGSWLATQRQFSLSVPQAVDDVLSGSGEDPMVLPVFTPPALPAGVTAAKPGALDRIFNLAGIVKRAAGYTEAIGIDLGIVGSEEEPKSMPRFSASTEQGSACQCVKLNFFKYGHMGVYIESRRGNGDWEFLTIDTENPYLDERPLLVANTPEVREYRMRFWDKGTPNGDWTDVAKITVSP